MCNDCLEMSNLWPFLNRQLSGNVKFVADFDVKFVAGFKYMQRLSGNVEFVAVF